MMRTFSKPFGYVHLVIALAIGLAIGAGITMAKAPWVRSKPDDWGGIPLTDEEVMISKSEACLLQEMRGQPDSMFRVVYSICMKRFPE